MKATPKEIIYLKSTPNEKFGGMFHNFKMTIIDNDGNETTGYYSTNDKGFNESDKTPKKFQEGVEADIEIHEMEGKNGKYYKFKPEYNKGGFSKYNHTLRREQARYSSFAYAYCKDLIVAGKLDLKKWQDAAKKAAKGMMEIDKELES